jgi:hypothetical protein
MSCWVFFKRCSLCRGLANTAMHLTRALQLPVAQRDHEPAAFCGQVMASVRRMCRAQRESARQRCVIVARGLQLVDG